MPSLRQNAVSLLTRRYPLYSGNGTLANQSFLQRLAGVSNENAWAGTPGGKLLAPLDDFVGRAAFYAGDLDPKITWVCRRLVGAGDTVLDVGANIGLITLLLARLVGVAGRVHAFEPNPRMTALLDQTLASNSSSQVCLHRFALGPENAELHLHIPASNAGTASLVRHQSEVGSTHVRVPVRTLDEVMAAQPQAHVRFMKLDVEGFEAGVLEGGRRFLAQNRPDAILFEINEIGSGGVRDQAVIRILEEHDYDFFAIPRCLFRMKLRRYRPESNEHPGNDLLAAPRGKIYEEIAARVRAD